MTRAEFDTKVAELESKEDIENAEGQLIDVFAVAEGHDAQVMIELLALNNEVPATIQPYLNPGNLLEKAKKNFICSVPVQGSRGAKIMKL